VAGFRADGSNSPPAAVPPPATVAKPKVPEKKAPALREDDWGEEF
jgi:hypothetical protein